MKIIIDYQPLVHDCVHSSEAEFIINCIELLTQKKPEIEWVFILDKKYVNDEAMKEIPSQNILFKKVIPNQLGWKFWYDYQLPSLIKKEKADLLIATGGIASSAFISQFVWAIGLQGNNHSKKAKKYLSFCKKRIKKTVNQSKKIFVASEKTKQFFIEKNNCDEHKLVILRSASDEYCQPLLWGEKQSVKTKYAAGNEYFFVFIDEQQSSIINVMKAFSIFKKRQQTNMQLLLAGEGLKNDAEFIVKLDTYKYRSDVHVHDYLDEEELRKLISAAYAFVQPFHEDETGTILLNAFKANVPAIVSEKGNLAEIAADAALYADADDIETLANQMMLLYKDEKLRNAQIEKGEQQWQKFSWDETVTRLNNVILEAMTK